MRWVNPSIAHRCFPAAPPGGILPRSARDRQRELARSGLRLWFFKGADRQGQRTLVLPAERRRAREATMFTRRTVRIEWGDLDTGRDRVISANSRCVSTLVGLLLEVATRHAQDELYQS